MIGFQILPFLKIFVTDFSGTMKASKLKVRINMDNDWMYPVTWNRGHGSIALGVTSLGRLSKQKLKCILLNNFYVRGPSLMKLIPHLVSNIRKVYWQNDAQRLITLELCPLIGFQILPFFIIFVTDFSGTMKARN